MGYSEGTSLPDTVSERPFGAAFRLHRMSELGLGCVETLGGLAMESGRGFNAVLVTDFRCFPIFRPVLA